MSFVRGLRDHEDEEEGGQQSERHTQSVTSTLTTTGITAAMVGSQGRSNAKSKRVSLGKNAAQKGGGSPEGLPHGFNMDKRESPL